jgi:hypothetical protein
MTQQEYKKHIQSILEMDENIEGNYVDRLMKLRNKDIDELIGENEELPSDIKAINRPIVERNQFRAELRKRAGLPEKEVIADWLEPMVYRPIKIKKKMSRNAT